MNQDGTDLDDVTAETSFEYVGRSYALAGVEGEYLFEKIRSTKTFYELELLEKLAEMNFDQGRVAVDVGANLGNHTVYMAAHLGLDVVAIEPEPDNYRLLEKNVVLNGIESNVELHNVAAMNHTGTVALQQRIEGNRGTYAARLSDHGIPATTVDEIVADQQVGVLKVDVEGSELEVLEGARSMISRDSPLVVVEAHTSEDRRQLNRFFIDMRYQPVAIAGISDNYFWMPNDARTSVAGIEAGKSSLEALRKEFRMSRAILDELVTARREISQVSHGVGALRSSGSQAGDAGAGIDQASLDRAMATVTDQSDALDRLRRSLAADSASNTSLISTYAQTLLSEVEAAAEQVRKLARSLDESRPGTSVADLESIRAQSGEIHARVARMEDSALSHIHRISDSLDTLLSETAGARSDIDQIASTAEVLGQKLEQITEGVEEQALSRAEAAHPSEGFSRLLSAYSSLAYRLERADPAFGSGEEIVRSLARSFELDEKTLEELDLLGEQPLGVRADPGFAASKMRRLYQDRVDDGPRRDRVRIGIASMAGREEGLREVLEILAPQADEICVYLNDIQEVPSVLPRKDNVAYYTGPDLGDRGKFAFMVGFEGYYLTCDDDIAYAPFHVQSILDGIERYGRSSVVGWHGSIFKKDFKKFYDSNSRQVLSFRFLRGNDTPVHLLGTGVCGFHTSTLDITIEDFTHPNMADVFVAIAAKNQNVPMVVLAHGKDWARPIDVGPSISTVSLKKDQSDKGDLDVAQTVTDLVLENRPWNILPPRAGYTRSPMTVAFIGRTDRARWKKGGILKSAHLTVDHLRRFGVETLLEDIVTGDPRDLHGRHADVIMLYVGDPERPDFKRVEGLVGLHASRGRKVIVNLSYNGKRSRTEFIRAKMAEWSKAYPGSVFLMAFTDSMASLPELETLRDSIVVVPKTLVFPDEPVASFGRSEGIFVGDVAKLSDDYLLDYPAKEWLAAIREALPGVKLYGVRQYKPKYDVPLDVDEVWPFLTPSDFVEKVGDRRLMISLVRYATFEMVPVEAAGLGVPVVYPEMPQSLSEHLGLGGFKVGSPAELRKILPAMYYDPIVWQSMSRAGSLRARSAELSNSAGQLYLRLQMILGNGE